MILLRSSGGVAGQVCNRGYIGKQRLRDAVALSKVCGRVPGYGDSLLVVFGDEQFQR